MRLHPRRIAFALAATSVIGCGLISGASDLEVVPDVSPASPGRTDAATDASTSVDATKESGVDASVDAKLPASRLREVTFESGQAVAPNGDGVDDLDGQGVVQSAVVLKGTRSLALEKGDVTVDWPEQNEVWLRWISLRQSVLAGTLAQVGPLTIDMVSAPNERAQIRVRVGSTVAATSPPMKVANVPLHVGVHLKKGTTNGVIEVWADAGTGNGQSAQFGAPFLSQLTASVTFPLTEVVIGNNDRTEMILDDIRVDNASMPP